MRMDGEFSVEGPQALQPFVSTQHPVTQEDILLRDPAYEVVPPTRNTITCSTADSFAGAVDAVCGVNALVELADDGCFSYRDAIGGNGTNLVKFALQPSPTARVLALGGGFACTQKQLLQWKDQWPGTLVPESNSPEATFGAIAAFKAEKGTTFEAAQDDLAIRLSATVEKKGADTMGIIPIYWKGISPLYEDHAEQTVTLRLEIKVPDVDSEGRLVGELKFEFSLWSPAASFVQRLAMDDAAERMGNLLPAFKVIRGRIG